MLLFRTPLAVSALALALLSTAGAQTDPLAAAAAEAGAVVKPSGLVYRAVKEGTGAQPSATSNVKVHYRGDRKSVV